MDLTRFFDVCFAVFVVGLGAKVFEQFGLHSHLWLLAYVWFFCLLIFHFSQFVLGLRENVVFTGYFLLCLVSVLWSEAAPNTLRISIQVTVSCLIAIYIGLRLSPREIFNVYLWVYAGAIFFSFLNQTAVFFSPFNDNGNFLGVFVSKNALGEGATALALAGTTAILFLPQINWMQRLLLLATAAQIFVMLGIAHSASGILLTIAGILGSIGATLLLTYPIGRAVMILAVVAACVVGSMFFALNSLNPVLAGLDMMGRSATLTGRTILWDKGFSVLADNPVLGIGFNAYWSSWKYQNEIIAFQSFFGEGVLSFHNLFVELLVSFGVLGILVHFAIGAKVFRDGAGLAIRYKDPLGAFVVMLVLVLYVQAMFGTTLYKPHGTSLIILIAFGVSMQQFNKRMKNKNLR